jgi:hypothetical protein
MNEQPNGLTLSPSLLTRDVFRKKLHYGSGTHVARTTGVATLNDGNGFPLIENGLRIKGC